MPRRIALRLLLFGFLGLRWASAAADSISCDGGIVSLGESRLDLYAKCGPPALEEVEPMLATAIVDPSLVIERWTYNFGPQRFIRVVSLRGGKVIAIETGGYGHALPDAPRDAPAGVAAVPRARCASDAVHIGDRTFEVLTKCGEPAYRDLRHGKAAVGEVWTYDFGRQSFVRFLEFEGGRIMRIRTGSYGYSN